MKVTSLAGRLRQAATLGFAAALVALAATGARAQLVANSYNDFSGTQGQGGWNYGYYDVTPGGVPDPDGYQEFDFIPFDEGSPGAADPARFGFNGQWDWMGPGGGAVNPPWTELAQSAVHPDSFDQPLGELWPIRRYVLQPEDVTGDGVAVLWRTRKTNLAGAGVTGKVFYNGVELGSDAVAFNDNVGIARSAYIPGAIAGGVIDLAYTPVGPTGDTGDGADGGQNFMKVRAGATPFVPYSAPVVPTLPGFTIYADSVTEFSGTQGQNNWHYGVYVPTGDPDGYQDYDLAEFPEGIPAAGQPDRFGFNGAWQYVQSNGNAPKPPWTFIGASDTHPNGTNNAGEGGVGENWVVRRWVSEVDANVTISGSISNSAGPTCGSDGTRPTIMVNGVQVFQQHVLSNSANYSVDVFVNAGDNVDFVTDNGASGADPCDGTVFTARIAPPMMIVEEIANSQTGFSGAQGQNGWRYGYWDRRRDEDLDSDGDGVYAPDEFVQIDPSLFDGDAWDLVQDASPWTELSAGGGHPAGPDGNVHWAVRRFTSPYDTVLHLEGTLFNELPDPNSAEDGTFGRIFVDGHEVWHALSRGNRVNYSLYVPVEAGSVIDFAIDSGFLDLDGSDSTEFTAVISRAIPEPSGVLLATIGLVAAAAAWKKRRQA